MYVKRLRKPSLISLSAFSIWHSNLRISFLNHVISFLAPNNHFFSVGASQW